MLFFDDPSWIGSIVKSELRLYAKGATVPRLDITEGEPPVNNWNVAVFV